MGLLPPSERSDQVPSRGGDLGEGQICKRGFRPRATTSVSEEWLMLCYYIWVFYREQQPLLAVKGCCCSRISIITIINIRSADCNSNRHLVICLMR